MKGPILCSTPLLTLQHIGLPASSPLTQHLDRPSTYHYFHSLYLEHSLKAPGTLAHTVLGWRFVSIKLFCRSHYGQWRGGSGQGGNWSPNASIKFDFARLDHNCLDGTPKAMMELMDETRKYLCLAILCPYEQNKCSHCYYGHKDWPIYCLLLALLLMLYDLIRTWLKYRLYAKILMMWQLTSHYWWMNHNKKWKKTFKGCLLGLWEAVQCIKLCCKICVQKCSFIWNCSGHITAITQAPNNINKIQN